MIEGDSRIVKETRNIHKDQESPETEIAEEILDQKIKSTNTDQEKMMIEYCVVHRSSIPGQWFSGDPNQINLIKANTPEDALNKIWKQYEMGKFNHVTYHIKV